ncbi:MAG: aspartate--tRNA ligase [bacterium]
MRILSSELNNKIGEKVELAGWIASRRDHGKLIFIDIRDREGITQVVFLPNNVSAHEEAEKLRPEWVIRIKGDVVARPDKMRNPDIVSGNVEVVAEELTVLTEAETLPFDVMTDGLDIGEDLRMQYRYLDIRRPRMAKNLRNRFKVLNFFRSFLANKGFVEIETPILTKSTPEGARDYLVPSRLQYGSFYALPQAPQQYKQLLMVAGIERYFQVARCFRDEDTRGDRQAEFTQVDMEMSFVQREDVMEIIEELCTTLVETLYPYKKISQKPWPRLNYDDVMEQYGTDRPDLRKDKNDHHELAFAWVINFPLFEKEKKDGHYSPEHNMFTAPLDEDISLLDTAPHTVKSCQYDVVLNGNEIFGGAIRIHDPKLQERIFEMIGFTEEKKQQFSHMLKAFAYGVPPHGGIASGFDRLLMVLENELNIREVIAFPKTGEGRDLMMDAPSSVDTMQLNELHIEIKKEDKK